MWVRARVVLEGVVGGSGAGGCEIRERVGVELGVGGACVGIWVVSRGRGLSVGLGLGLGVGVWRGGGWVGMRGGGIGIGVGWRVGELGYWMERGWGSVGPIVYTELQILSQILWMDKISNQISLLYMNTSKNEHKN